MSPRNVGLVLGKELRETLRDRRTILIMIVVPVFLYPALLVFLQQLAIFGQRQLEEEPARVVLVGEAPELEGLLAGDPALSLSRADRVPALLLRRGALEAVIEVSTPGAGGETRAVRLHYDASRERSQYALPVLESRLLEWGDSLLARRLEAQGLPASFAVPVELSRTSVATAERMGGYTLGRFLPILLILMTLLGAYYPAIDLTAGEKERGTLEALLTTPVPAREVVAGKFLAVSTLAVAAAALNLGSMLLTFQSGLFQMEQFGEMEIRLPAATIALVLLFLVPLAVFFAALFLGLAVRAQSFKEAQNALTPVQLLSIVPTYLPLIPGIPFSYGLALVPIGGVAVLFRELMAGGAPLGPSLVALGATTLYALLALRFATRAFGREEVLFGSGSARVATATWRERLRHWRLRGRVVPTAAEALAFVGAVGLLYFYLGVRLQFADAERGLLASQWLLLALPAVLLVVLGPYRARATLALRPPAPRALAAAALVIAGGIPVGWLLAWLQSFVLEIPEEFLGGLEALLTADGALHLAWLLLVVAVTPAVCEELVFRGVLLQGLGSEMPMRRAVIGSAIVFGAFHLSFETAIRFLPTAWLGLLIGYVVWRSGSLFAGMLMHFLNNGSILILVLATDVQGYLTGPGGEPRWAAVLGGLGLLAAGLKLLPDAAAAPRERGPRVAPLDGPAEPIPGS